MLKSINPFNYEQYCSEILDFPLWMVKYVQRNSINSCTGWVKHFEQYNFTGEKTWDMGVKYRRDFHGELHGILNSNTGSSQDIVYTANRIVKDWGHINKGYKAKDGAGILEALEVLCSETTDPNWDEKIDKLFNFTPSHRVASHSKIYEMFEPSQWSIYDSRVAIALACLVHQYWQEKRLQPGLDPDYIRFPIAIGRDLRHPYADAFPSLGSRHQSAMAFIYASWLLRRVAEIIRSSPAEYGYPPTKQCSNTYDPLDSNWQVYHIEMALWMMGDKNF